jgi:rhodanese-related sulfurtransferase
MRPGITSFVSCASNSLREASILLVTASVLSLFFSLWHPWSDLELDQLVPSVTNAEASKGDWIWVDARSHQDFEAGHVPTAINVNEDDWEAGLSRLLERWLPGQKILVYCSSMQCHSSRSVAVRIKKELDTDQVYVLKGGWETWSQNHRR